MGGAASAIVSTVSGLDPTGVTGNIFSNMQGQNAAKAQRGMMEAQLSNEERMRAEASAVAAPSEYEINRLEDAYQANNNELQRRQKILDSSDPALIEAGRQTLALLQGTEAKSLAPIKRQREEQRKQLEAKLRSTLGSGYANSSAGIQALNQFDQQTGDVLGNAQQQSLGQLLGVAQSNSANFGLLPVSQGFASLAQARGNINIRQANALQGNRIQSVGGGQLEDYLNATGNIATSRAQQAQGERSMDRAISLFGAMNGGGGGGGQSMAGNPKDYSNVG